jgi:hypothetical protein
LNLWHQTIRYKDGALKPGLEQTPDLLDDTCLKVTLLSIEMKHLVEDVSAFLEARRLRRLERGMLERVRQKGGR